MCPNVACPLPEGSAVRKVTGVISLPTAVRDRHRQSAGPRDLGVLGGAPTVSITESTLVISHSKSDHQEGFKK